MKKLHILYGLLLIAILSSCSSLRTAYDYDKDVDFTKYQTFAFYKEGMDQLKLNDIDKKRFVEAITADLQSKGFESNVADPDLLVNVVVTGKDKVSVTDDYPFSYGWWYPSPTLTMRQYTESTIYIDLIDKDSNQLVWQGKGTDEFNASEKDRDTRVKETVTRILEQYPYGRK
ncbi:uncharacterized protein DUF4136 [Balneicella halophila]|uniref:Uncharacterized protein DUF4136 n=1 Tax=Balneicella halophila TaxID=1537566 RepID=A0A7L4UPR6_BALHA|nr:DUF4136 domain-containing protein [Balneicella halophila]PVX51034.1 uncharacterized protein DUF4136 [Balneicella halophila]